MTSREQQILALIRDDPMISQRTIAKRLGITRSAVAGHIMKLTKKGAIKGRGYVVSEGPFVAVIGGANIDIHGKPARPLRLQDSNPGTVHTSPGGVARNIAENLSRLGADCRLITAVGDDQHGRLLFEQGRDAGIDMQHVIRISGAQTSTYMSVLDRSGDMHVAVNDMSIMNELKAARLKHQAAMLKQAALIVIDTNLPGDAIAWLTSSFSKQALFVDTVSDAKCIKIEPYLSAVHTLKTSRSEAEVLTGLRAQTQKQLSRVSRWFHDRGVTRLFVTLGKRGVFYSTDDSQGIQKLQSKKGKVASTGGAGDAFLAGLAHAWLEHWSLSKSVQFALSAAQVTVADSASSSPALSLAAVNRVVEAHDAR